MSTKQEEILVNGFVREIQKILDENKLIPLEVIQICSVFYSIPLSIFYFSTDLSKMHILNGKYNYNLVYSGLIGAAPNPRIKSACYIPDMSSFINIKNTLLSQQKRYDGIVAVTKYNIGNIPNIILFESNINYNTTTEYYSFSFDEIVGCSSSTIDLIYSHEIGSVMFCDEWRMYQMELQDINLSKHTFRLTEIPVKNDIVNSYASTTPSIGYMHGQNKLFLAQNSFNGTVFWETLTRNSSTSKSYAIKTDVSQCGIFDLEEEEWIIIKPFAYNMYAKHYSFSMGICQNNKYDSNNVYIASNIGHAAKFDTDKQKWITFIEDLDKENGTKPVVWMDDSPFIINSSDYIYYRYFDVRENKKQWIENDAMYKKVNNLFQITNTKDKRQRHTFFL